VPLAAGTRLGTFEIVGALGAGGMGEVYRARDAKLGRDVAIKILPPAVAADPERLARFRREARVLASLNHPHIGGIYGFEDASGMHALVLELVEVETLADRIAAGALSIDESLAIARQIGQALDAAHEAGIIHRDLKPANIKIRRDGTVKILDFGLAKALDDERGGGEELHASTVTSAGSRSGLILGTPAYMSPEQARGQAVGKRTDIWAFGCVLYEMLTGRRAFEGATVSDTIVSVLSKDPDWSALPAATPPSVRRLIGRCLERDPKRRLRDVGDALADLTDTAPSGRTEAAMSASGAAARWAPWLLAILAIAAALAVALRDRASKSDAGASSPTFEQLTYDAGLTTMPALSPDGNLLAYASDRAGRGDVDIWVQRTTGGAPLRLTDDPADDHMPDFSPDGSQVVFRSERAGGGIYLVPALGGPARRIMTHGRDPKFSPDGQRIAYWTGAWRGIPTTLRSAVFLASLSGGEPTRMLADFQMARGAAWAPDGQSLVVLGRRDGPETFDWWFVPLNGRPAVQTGIYELLGRPLASFSAHAWRPPTLVVSAGGYNLWSADLSTAGKAVGKPRILTPGASEAFHPAVGRDGAIVFAGVQRHRVISRVPLVDGVDQRPVLLYSDARGYAARAGTGTDGRVLVFEQWFPRHHEIWQKDLTTGRQEMVVRLDTATEEVNATPSPDGSRIAYTVPESGTRGAGYVIEASGGVPRKVCDTCNVAGFFSDNHRVLARWGDIIGAIDTRNGTRSEVIRADGGAIDRPHISPDDRWIAFRHGGEPGSGLFVAPVAPGRPAARALWARIEDPTTTGRPAGWSLDSRTLYLLLDTDGFRCLWGQRVDGAGRLSGRPFAVRHFHDINEATSTTLGNAITREGFVYETIKRTGNLWKLTLPVENRR
jgi:Tol biopolymer transport system component